jgi:hypothetical protein
VGWTIAPDWKLIFCAELLISSPHPPTSPLAPKNKKLIGLKAVMTLKGPNRNLAAFNKEYYQADASFCFKQLIAD